MESLPSLDMLKETGEDAYCGDISFGKVCFERGKEERKYINDSLPKKKPDKVGKYVHSSAQVD